LIYVTPQVRRLVDRFDLGVVEGPHQGVIATAYRTLTRTVVTDHGGPRVRRPTVRAVRDPHLVELEAALADGLDVTEVTDDEVVTVDLVGVIGPVGEVPHPHPLAYDE
jgi:hypothetical protein